jgi:hypothetical protein
MVQIESTLSSPCHERGESQAGTAHHLLARLLGDGIPGGRGVKNSANRFLERANSTSVLITILVGNRRSLAGHE